MNTAEDFEKIIVKSLFVNTAVRDKVIPLLDPKWFKNNISLAKIANKIIEFNEQFEAMPSPVEMRRVLRDESLVKSFDECMAITDSEVMSEYLIGEIEEFVRQKKMYNVATGIMDYLKTPDENKAKLQKDFADEIIDAESFSFDTSIGFDFINELDRIYDEVIKNEKLVTSGLKTIDELLHGGFHEKSLSLILAPTNVGKTLMMCSLAANMVRAGFNVLYVTFEDSELKIGARIAQNVFDVSQDQLKAMSREEYERARDMLKNTVKSSLFVKEYPESAINALTLKNFIKELKDKQKFVPDIMFVDYIGCMIPNGKENANLNTNSILLKVAAQVRAISMEYGFPIVSGSQVNRGGFDLAEVNLNDAADSFGQTMKADAIFAVTQTPELKEQNYYNIKLAKTRFGNNKGTSCCIRVDIDKQRISDLTTSNGSTPTGLFEAVSNDTGSKFKTMLNDDWE